MSRLQAVERDCSLLAFVINRVKLRTSLQNQKWTVVWRLQRSPNCIVSNENMCARGQFVTDIRLPMLWLSCRRSLQTSHSCLELCCVRGLVGRLHTLRLIEELPWESQGTAIHQLGSCAPNIFLECRTDAQQNERKCSHPAIWLWVGFQGCLQLSMEAFNETIGDGVIGRCTDVS
jgi:hypothetical protein